MSTTVATATTTTATVASAGGATSSKPTSSTPTTSATSTPVLSTATSSTPTATPSTGAAAPGTPFATPFGPGGAPFVTPLPSCLMPESFTGSGDFEDYLQQFNTAALLSGWFSPSHDNRPHYFALQLRGNALHSHFWRIFLIFAEMLQQESYLSHAKFWLRFGNFLIHFLRNKLENGANFSHIGEICHIKNHI